MVLSFADAHVRFIGRVTDYALSVPKPSEFGSVGANWSAEGWLLPVTWVRLNPAARPKDFMDVLGTLLPTKYSPINPVTGNGNQKAYLAEISRAVFESVTSRGTFDQEALRTTTGRNSGDFVELLEVTVEERLKQDVSLGETERTQLLKARRGQGQFRERLCRIEQRCRVTGVSNLALLVASHIKPWRACTTAQERLDGYNGLLLTPHVDLLFDRGLLSFGDEGRILLCPRLERDDLERLGLETRLQHSVGTFLPEQRRYLRYHREHVFLAE
ncbi:HNH endonuclease [Hyalangium sp.]|uniref:HNH endonuclease n=1 Tax=Hyalangium sp. TaxID=2028555 RepID=UPI002D5B52B1|nr:HNH endonuclease [Hyalangium sp.]HYH94933.1 HNH endonuclease [Hyalangium sp.]